MSAAARAGPGRRRCLGTGRAPAPERRLALSCACCTLVYWGPRILSPFTNTAQQAFHFTQL